MLRWSWSAQEPAPKRHLAFGAGSLQWQLIDHLPARPSIGRRPAAAHHAFVFANGRLVGITAHSKLPNSISQTYPCKASSRPLRAELSQGHLIGSNRPDQVAITGAFDMTAVDEIPEEPLHLSHAYQRDRTDA